MYVVCFAPCRLALARDDQRHLFLLSLSQTPRCSLPVQVDLSEQPHRRRDMLIHSNNNYTLPQLHVNNKFIGKHPSSECMLFFHEHIPTHTHTHKYRHC